MPKTFQKGRSIHEYGLFMEAWSLMAISRILIFWIPFRKLLPLLGQQASREAAALSASARCAPVDLLKQIQVSIARACRRSPWRTKCFEQALTARMMLRKRKLTSVIYFGVRMHPPNREEKMIAHAWLTCSGVVVTGGENNEQFTVVGRFLV